MKRVHASRGRRTMKKAGTGYFKMGRRGAVGRVGAYHLGTRRRGTRRDWGVWLCKNGTTKLHYWLGQRITSGDAKAWDHGRGM